MGTPCAYVPSVAGGERLRRALGALEEQTVEVDVVVIDNGSEAGAVSATTTEFPRVRVLRMPHNIGFGAAINAALRTHPAEHVVLINDDVEPEPQFVEALLDELVPTVDMVAGVLLRADDPSCIDSAGVIADTTLMAFDHLHGLNVAAAQHAPAPLGPTGAAALLRLEALEAASGFDERLFAYYEDLDLALRVRSAGGTCRLAAEARGRHLHAATLGAASAEKYALTGFGRGYLLRRYGVMTRPRSALRALAAEAVVCAGQIALDRTVAGVSGRLHGWSAAGAVAQLRPPDELLIRLPLSAALNRRRRDYGLRAPSGDTAG